MLNFLDIYERALQGPIMSEGDFDLKVLIPELRQVVKDHGIRYDRDNPIPADDAGAECTHPRALPCPCPRPVRRGASIQLATLEPAAPTWQTAGSYELVVEPR